MRPTSIALALVAVSLVASPTHAAPLIQGIYECGQVIPPNAYAFLSTNMDCSGDNNQFTVTLGKKATLDLQGYTLTTGPNYGVGCLAGHCVIKNGTIQGNAVVGIAATRSLVDNMTVNISGSIELPLGGSIALALSENSTIRGSTVNGSAGTGIYNSAKKTTKIVDSTISGSQRYGVWTYRAKLVNSTVTGNSTDPGCGTSVTCADLYTAKRPQLKYSSCGTSSVVGLGDIFDDCHGWCVCTDD
jgi:hypothetical protein